MLITKSVANGISIDYKIYHAKQTVTVCIVKINLSSRRSYFITKFIALFALESLFRYKDITIRSFLYIF